MNALPSSIDVSTYGRKREDAYAQMECVVLDKIVHNMAGNQVDVSSLYISPSVQCVEEVMMRQSSRLDMFR